MAASEAPPVAAVFEVVFDQKVGYKLGWKRSLPDVDLDGVEFKCLPSGLHSVKEDLVYFIHGIYAGVSAFVQEKADEQHRNAHLVAIGALVPLTYGRLGKSWRHAAELRRLAREKVKEGQDCRALELFWVKNRQQEGAANDATPVSPSTLRTTTLPDGIEDAGRKRKRARSDASGTLSSSGDFLTPDHPALSMPDLLETLGPLIFPLHRAALLRKRILLLGSPPVQQICNFVYDLSILASIPQYLTEILPSETEDFLRMKTLFSVGVQDIPHLLNKKKEGRWLACTTDDILGEKKDLYDIHVKPRSLLPPSRPGRFPQVRTSDGKDLKATQRDLRRYRLLRSELNRTAASQPRYRDDPESSNDDDDDGIAAPLMRASTTTLLNEVKPADPGDHLVCEPVSWTAMAYNGFMWWASAGEMEAWENEEMREDRQLLEEIPEPSDLLRHMEPNSSNSREQEHTMQQQMAQATVLTAYFHRLTSRMLQPLAALVENADDETADGVAEEGIIVRSEDVRDMGLDVWSKADREFVEESAEVWFGRKAKVDEWEGVRVCGVRIC